MRSSLLLGALLTAPLACAAAAAAEPAPSGADAAARSDLDAKVAKAAAGQGREVSIPFVDHGGIRSWRAVDRDTLLLEGTHGRWYRAELMGGCFELPFAHSIGFKSNPTGDFDRSSAVLVRGQRCQVRSLTETAPPAKSRRGAVAPPAATAAQPDGAAPVEDVTLPR